MTQKKTATKEPEAPTTIDGILSNLYTAAGDDFNNKLQVAREMVKLELARIRKTEDDATVPDFYAQED